MNTTFELQNGEKINVFDNKYYRIGLLMPKIINSKYHPTLKYIETFYMLNPNEIKKHIKKYEGELVYIVEMNLQK